MSSSLGTGSDDQRVARKQNPGGHRAGTSRSALAAGFRPVHWLAVPRAFLYMILIALVFAGLGTAIGSRLQDMQGFQLIMNFLVMPIFFLSGALFPLEPISPRLWGQSPAPIRSPTESTDCVAR